MLRTSITIAQNPVTVSGRIITGNEAGAVGATVALLSAADSSLVKAAASDDGGNFELAYIRPGSYLLRVTNVGYDDYKSNTIVVDGSQNIQLPVITLLHSSTTLTGVTVTMQKPLIEVKADKTVFNVENSINAAGSTAFELLQKSRVW